METTYVSARQQQQQQGGASSSRPAATAAATGWPAPRLAAAVSNGPASRPAAAASNGPTSRPAAAGERPATAAAGGGRSSDVLYGSRRPGGADKLEVIRRIERAVRPASAVTGLGERDAGGGTPPRAHRAGQGQASSPGAWAPRQGQAARELWSHQVVEGEAKHCAACRGGHDRAKEHNPAWAPYAPRRRLEGMHLLETKFALAHRMGTLPVALSDSFIAPVRWVRVSAEGDALKPDKLSEAEFGEALALMLEGARDGHEPFRFLATQAALELMATRSRHLPKAAAAAARPLRLALNTMEPSLLGTTLLLLQRRAQAARPCELRLPRAPCCAAPASTLPLHPSWS